MCFLFYIYKKKKKKVQKGSFNKINFREYYQAFFFILDFYHFINPTNNKSGICYFMEEGPHF